MCWRNQDNGGRERNEEELKMGTRARYSIILHISDININIIIIININIDNCDTRTEANLMNRAHRGRGRGGEG